MTQTEQLAMRLYRKMPNAPTVHEDVPQATDEWDFCMAIAQEIIAAAQAYSR